MNRPRLTPRQLWWLPTCLQAGVTLSFGIAALALHERGLATVFLCWTGWVILSARSAVIWFKRGWHAGFAEGLTLTQDIQQGNVPVGLMRSVATGDPAPNPWDDVASDVTLTMPGREEEP